MSLSQNDSGRAFEYGLVVSFSEYLNAKIKVNNQIRIAKKCFKLSIKKEKEEIVKASNDMS